MTEKATPTELSPISPRPFNSIQNTHSPFLAAASPMATKVRTNVPSADFTEAIRLNPTYALAFGNRGLVYERKDSYDRAITDFNEAIRLDPNYAIAFRGRGIVYGNKGDYDRAIADFTEAIRLDPKLGYRL